MSKQTSIELPNTHAENPVGQSVAVKRKRGRPAKQTTLQLDETVETASTSAEHSCGNSSTMSKQNSIVLPNTHAANPVGQSVAVKRKRGRPAKQTK